jgi:hypothetical protein
MLDTTFSGLLPEQNLSDAQIIAKFGSLKNYYSQCGRYWSRRYNRLASPATDKTQVGVGMSEALQILDNFDYFHGIQQNSTFYYLSQGLNGNEVNDMSTPYMPGQDISTILTFLQGQFLGIASNAEPRVNVINPDMKNKITAQLKMVEVARVFKDQLKKLTETTGISFVPPANPEASTDEVVKTVSMSFATGLTVDAGKLLEYVRKQSMSVSDLSRSFINNQVGRRSVLYVTPDGRIINIEPERYFSVSSKSDDFGKYDIARGMVQYIHKDEVLRDDAEWLTDDEKEIIKNGQFNTPYFLNDIAPQFNYSLWNADTQFVSKVTVFWKTTIDSRTKITTTTDGEDVVRRLKAASKKKGEPVQVIKKVEIIAGTIAVNYGVYDVIEDPDQLGNKLYPLLQFQPNTFNGINQCMVDKTKNKQKELDAINYRVRENYTTDLGTILAFNGKKFDKGISPTELYQQLRANRVTVSTHTGEDDDRTNIEPIMQREDVSLMRDIENYLRIKEAFKADIKEIANVSAFIMGSQSEYIGLKTQQNSAALASNSYQYAINGTLQLWADAAAIAIMKIKTEICNNPLKMKWQNLLGEDGIERLLAIKDDRYTQFLLSISTRDIIDPTRKARMLGMLDNLMSTGQIDFVDWLNVEDAKTISELKDYAKYSVEKKRLREIYAQSLNAAAAEERAAMMAQSQQDAKLLEMQGGVQKQKTANTGKVATAMVNKDYSPDEIAAFIQGAQAQGQQGGGVPQQGGGVPPEQGGVPMEQMQGQPQGQPQAIPQAQPIPMQQ